MAAAAAAAAVAVVLAACSSGGHGNAAAPGTTTSTAADQGATTTAPPITVSVLPSSTTTSRPTGPHSGPATAPTPPPVAGGGASSVVPVWTVGAWGGAGRLVNGSPAVFTTLLQPSTGGSAVGAARLDTSRLRLALYAGTTDPAGSWTNQGAVPSSLWPSLVATFNSGFKLDASRGGFYADGRAAAPLRNGAASLVIYQDGSATVGSWGRDAQLDANVVAVRQNLELLVDGGRPAADVSTNIQPTWGFTLNNVVANWRSAVGVDGAGRLLYVGGPGLFPAGLAGALISVGAVRAMELDINPAWVSFDTFTDGSGDPTGAKLLPNMNFPATHYLSPSTRDFVAVFAR